MTGKSTGRVRGRWWRRLIKAVIFVCALGLVGVLVAPKLVVRQLVQAALTAAELEPFAFEIVAVGWQKLVLSDITLGAEPDFAVDEIEISYKLSDLWRGQVDRVRLLRPNLRAVAVTSEDVADSPALSFGVLDHVLYGRDGASSAFAFQIEEVAIQEGGITVRSGDEIVLTSRVDASFGPEAQSDLSFEATGGPKIPGLSASGRLLLSEANLQMATIDADIPQFDFADWRLRGAAFQLEFDAGRSDAVGAAEIRVESFAFPTGWLDRFEKYLKPADPAVNWTDGFEGLAVTARASLLPSEGGISGKLLEPLRISKPDGATNLVFTGHQSLATDFRLGLSDAWSFDMNVRAEQTGAWLPQMDLEIDATLRPGDAAEGPVGIVARRVAGGFNGLQFGRLRVGSRDVEVVGKGGLRNFTGTAKGGLRLDGDLGRAFSFEESIVQLDGAFQLLLPGGLTYTHTMGSCAELNSQNVRIIQLYLPNSNLNFCPDRELPIVDLALGAGDASQMVLAASITGDSISITDQDRFNLNGLLPKINLSTDFDVDQGQWTMAYKLAGGALIFGDQVSLLDELSLTGIAAGSSDGIENVEMDLTRMQVSSAGKVGLFAPFLINGQMRTANRLGKFTGDLFDEAQRQMGGYDGEHDWRTQSGFLKFDTGVLALKPNGFQPQVLFPVFADVMADANGAMRATGLIDWKDGSLTSNGEVELIDIDFASLVGPVSGVNSQIKLGSLLPLATLTPQRIDIQQIDVGIDLFFGEFLFSLMADGRVVLEEAVWPWAGGEIGFDRAALILDDTPQELGLFVRSVDLAEVFALLDIDGLTGSGFLEGQLPIRAEDGGITVLNGTMTSLGGGTISYKGPVSLSSETEDGSKLMFDALENFSYDTIRVSISGRTTDDLKVAITLEGKNPAVLDGYPFKINISTEGPLAEMVREGTIGYRVPERIRKQLQ